MPKFGVSSVRSQDRWAIAVGDVSGKGMPAALLMARLSAEVGLLLQMEPDRALIVERLNRNLCASRTEDRFITFLLLVLNAERHEMTVVNAGHMAPMIRRFNGDIEVIGRELAGPPLGIMEDHQYEAVTASVSPGDVALLYTDGVNEALNKEGRLFGMKRLTETLANAPSGVAGVGQSILDAVRHHAAGCDQSDDITLLCFGPT
jgi:serine phosphatase RsbU (regulator of sigma subunit)